MEVYDDLARSPFDLFARRHYERSRRVLRLNPLCLKPDAAFAY